jgi:two-component system, cell cycle response regulator
MPQKILLIDDSEPIHTLVKSLLGDETMVIHSAFDAQSGLVLAASLQPDLILLDVEMPTMDGFETCRKLKADPVTANLPIIFLTVHGASEEMVRGLDLGATDYVAKPFKQSELLSRVRAALRTNRVIRLLEEKAMIDSLTGLGNRAMFEERLAAEMSLRIRTGNPLSCIALDVDHFKSVNDTFGHPYGDYVLRAIANTLLDICRLEDVACRHGGEEFIILAPRTVASQAAMLAERMRIAISKIPFEPQGKSLTVTCSFGVAEAAGLYDRSMLDRLDRALYESKERGRNRVSIAPSQSQFSSIAA